VNINLNICIDPTDDITPEQVQDQVHDVIARAHLIQEQLGINAIQGVEMSARTEYAPPTSRHHQSVAANVRIMDAIEFINKEIRLLKGNQDSGALKVLKEVRHILLDI
jgi:hypothetical protein